MTALPLASRIAVVTGGASGIGQAIAERLTADGATVVIADIDAERGEGIAATLDRATFVRTDVTVAGDRERLVGAAMAVHGRIDILVNDAGVQHVAPIHHAYRRSP